MIRSTIAFVGGLALIAAASAPSLAAAPLGNIRVAACVANQGTQPETWSGPWGAMVSTIGTPSTLTIHYTNLSPKTAKTIVFGLTAGGVMKAAVRDKGTFSTGALIQHVFGISDNVFPLGTAFTFCVPLQVKYADGSVWQNTNIPPMR
jgi:hypothetical protein